MFQYESVAKTGEGLMQKLAKGDSVPSRCNIGFIYKFDVLIHYIYDDFLLDLMATLQYSKKPLKAIIKGNYALFINQ